MEAPCAQSTRGGGLGGFFCGAWLAPLVPQSWGPEKLCALQELGMGSLHVLRESKARGAPGVVEGDAVE